jgi:alkylation response protein AidB-like acyl-CoA dehydrogenase
MNFDPTEEQQLLAASIARFVERDYPFDVRRAIVASPAGHSAAIWRTLAELGLLGLTLPEDHGGFGGGAQDAMSLMNAIGEALIVEPWLATVGTAAQLVARGGSDAQKHRILPAVADGSLTLAFAHAEAGARHDLAHVTTRARPDDGGYALTGAKCAIAHAQAADVLIVSARTEDDDAGRAGIALFLVERTAAGVHVAPRRMLDGTRAADVVLDGVRASADARIGAADDALPLIEAVIDFATALLCAEAAGAIASANRDTLEYLKTRRQFGVPIGSFQALQHRMVDMTIDHEQVRSMASLVCAAVDGTLDAAARARVVSAAKVRIADACRRVSQESVQLHGGMGMTAELKISHTFRRLTAIAQQFGDADHHLERFATLSPIGEDPA